jgi:hypothetical protein
MRTFIAFVVGFGSGWAVRSLADSPQGVGVALLARAHDARERLGRWVAMERDRIEDMMAEARSSAEEHANHVDVAGRGRSERGPAQRAHG